MIPKPDLSPRRSGSAFHITSGPSRTQVRLEESTIENRKLKIYLSIDPGDKRTGLAVGDDETGHVGPVGVIEPSDPPTLLGGIRSAIEEHGPDELVVGVPYNMDGSEGPAAKKAQALAALLGGHTGLPVHLVDERLTSFAADEVMKQTGLTHKQKKARRDALAAAAILRDFLHRR